MTNCINLADYDSLQQAVDDVPVNGTLFVPPGIWKKGAAALKSNMTLFLAKGAVLSAPEKVEQHVENTLFKRSTGIARCFIGIFEAQNVTIEGEGTLEGNGHLHWPGYDGMPDCMERDPDTGFYRYPVYQSTFPRPSLCIVFKSKNVRFRDISICNSASYTVWAVGCEMLSFDRISIRNIRRGPNTDGLDIDCCSDVRISGCNLITGDDSIALKSDISILGYDKPCERIHISDNTLSSYCCAVRLGFEGDGAIRDVIFTNNIINSANIGFDVLSCLPGVFDIRKGSKIENIIVRGMIMRDVRQAFKLWNLPCGEEKMENLTGFIHNVTLADMQIEAVDSSFIGGKDISGILLENIRMHVKRFENAYKGETPVPFPTVWGRGYMPEALTLYMDPEIITKNVKITESIVKSSN